MILRSQMVETPIFYPGLDRDVVTVGTDGDIVAATRLEMHLSILTLKATNGKTPLHVLCENSADTTMMKIMIECCPLEKLSVVESATARNLVRMANSNGRNLLHFLVCRHFPFSSLKLMMQYCPPVDETDGLDPRLMQDEDGEVPLHWAFAEGVSPGRLTVLLSECHDSLLCAKKECILPMEEYLVHWENYYFHEENEKQAVWHEIQGMLKVVTGYQGFDAWSPLHAILSSLYTGSILDNGVGAWARKPAHIQ